MGIGAWYFHRSTLKNLALAGGVLLLVAGHGLAGEDVAVPLKPFKFHQTTVVKEEETLLIRGPYLALVGPTAMRFGNDEQTFFRSPPPLPKPKKKDDHGKKEDDKNVSDAKPLPEASPTPDGDDVLSASSAPISTAPPPPRPPTPAAEQMDAPGNALSNTFDDHSSLSDAVIYFNPANGQHREMKNTTIEATVPLDQPVPIVPQPPSNATYESK
ncbi:MAG: hypothetical protein QM796_13015 [Chthoniobacteraceae bacterium]